MKILQVRDKSPAGDRPTWSGPICKRHGRTR